MESSSEEIPKIEKIKNKEKHNISTTTINTNDKNKTKINLIKKIIERISGLLSEICEENTKKYKNFKNEFIKPFLTKAIPPISIKDYIEHLYKYTNISSSTIVVMLIYIERLCNICKCKLTYFNIHKLILSSFIVASKYNEDEYYSPKFYSKIGGVTKTEIVNLEFSFITFINFNLFITEDIFNKYNDYISSPDSDDEDDFDDLND